MMDVGDPEPSHLPNLATLRKAKQEMGDKELGDKDPIMSLHLLKYSVPHDGSIHDIGLDSFFLPLLGPIPDASLSNEIQVLWFHCEF